MPTIPQRFFREDGTIDTADVPVHIVSAIQPIAARISDINDGTIKPGPDDPTIAEMIAVLVHEMWMAKPVPEGLVFARKVQMH